MAPEEWDELPDKLKDAINEGLEQAEAGQGIPASEFFKKIRKKYGLDKLKDWWDDIDSKELKSKKA